MKFEDFFKALTGSEPYPYQCEMARSDWPGLIDVPTGLGKTAAVVIAWLWKRLEEDESTPRRLVYCLPMRSLVDQTASVAATWSESAQAYFRDRGLEPPRVAILRGGEVDLDWDSRPEYPQIIVGTQDLLLSRALNRGYAMIRYRWPIHFAWLHNDALWIFDECQLMGVAVETGSQLQAFRDGLGVVRATKSVWMSATLDPRQVETVDRRGFLDECSVATLSDRDRALDRVQRRLDAVKRLRKAESYLSTDSSACARSLASEVAEAYSQRGGLVLVVVNRVGRAQEVFKAIRSELPEARCALVHSRMRRRERLEHESVLTREDGDRVVVATQTVEAGIDVSAETLFFELAPWPSCVQRLGRCNRYGESNAAQAFWIDVDLSDENVLPYSAAELESSREIMKALENVSPSQLRSVAYEVPPTVRPVIRRKDILELFDTTPEVLGHDLDVSRFIRDDKDTDVQVFWRRISDPGGEPRDPGSTEPRPGTDEVCPVSLSQLRSFLRAVEKRERAQETPLAWTWDFVAGRWSTERKIHPGSYLLLESEAGGYESNLGWTGAGTPPVEPIATDEADTLPALDDDPETRIGRWVSLAEHSKDVEAEATSLAERLIEDPGLREVLTTAAWWHDVGKAHPEFQARVLAGTDGEDVPKEPGPWAKSARPSAVRYVERPYFRHELASALAWMAWSEAKDLPRQASDLVAYLIAAHHGKVRMSIRSVPRERTPGPGARGEPSRLFARGVWDGDVLPQFGLPDGESVGPMRLELRCMRMGEESWLDRMLLLRDCPEFGPFRMAYLEALVRIADWRASASEAGA